MKVMPFLFVLDASLVVIFIFKAESTYNRIVVSNNVPSLDDFSMRQLTQLLSGVFLLVVFAASVTFTYYNSTPIAIGIGSWQLQALPVSVWIVGAFVSGGLLGLLLGLGLFRNLKSRVEIRRLSKALTEAQEEVSNLRALSLRDTKK